MSNTKPKIIRAEIRCAHTEIRPVESLIENPRNPNHHPESQLKLLAKIITATGWRSPIVVSNRSGFVVKGHGRLQAAKLAGLTEAPVDLQDYESEAAEWADMIADNRLAELAEMSLPELKDLLLELDTGALDMDLTGFNEDALAMMMSQFMPPNDANAEWEGMPEFSNEPKAHRTIHVHFKTAGDVSAFAALVGQSITEKTKFIWHPAQASRDMKSLRFTSADET